MKLVLVIIIVMFKLNCFSQLDSDLQLALNYKTPNTNLPEKRKANYVFKDKNWFLKYNPLSLVFGGSLLFYQKVISPQIVMGCAFDVSCSNFSKGCIKEFGVVKGVALSTDRLTRCTRLSSVDFHPILFKPNGKVDDLPQYYHLDKRK